MSEVKELPKGWEWKKLGEICDTTSGGTPNRKNNEYYGGNIPWVKSGELNRGIITDTEEKITKLGLENSSAKLFPRGTLLIALYGATIGKLAFLGIEAATNQAICGIYENEELSSKFMYNYLLYKKDSLVKHAIGGAQPNISQTILKNLDVPHPSIETQQAIVSKIEELFSEVDKGIETLRTAQQQLKTYRQSVLKWAFEGKLTEEWRKKNTKKVKGAVTRAGTPARQTGGEPKGDLPEGWVTSTLNQIGAWKGGGTPSKANKSFWTNGTILWVSPKDMKSEKIIATEDKITQLAIDSSSTKLVAKNSILFVMRSGILRRTLPVAINVSDVTLNQDMQALTPFEDLPQYIYWFTQANNEDIRRRCSKNGTTVESIESSLLKNYNIVIAPKLEQQAIIEEIESRLSVADKMEESIATSLQQAEGLKQSILKIAFEGRLVSEVKPTADKDADIDYLYKVQMMALIAKISKKKGIAHGEMTIAKYEYLLQEVFGIPTGFKFERWHLGPYTIEMKKVVNNSAYFTKVDNSIEVVDAKIVSGLEKECRKSIESAVNELATIFLNYPAKTRAHKTELLATVCKVIEDIKSIDLAAVRASMEEWKIDLKTSPYKNKAEKFTEPETKKCLAFIIGKGWDKKLINMAF